MIKHKSTTIYHFILGLLFLVLFLIGTGFVNLSKYIDKSLAMLSMFIAMLIVFYLSVKKLKNKKLTALEEEEKGYTKEGAIGIVGIVIFIIGFLLGEKLIRMILTNILGIIILGIAVYLQFRKSKTNKYVLRNVKHYLYAWIGMIIWFVIVIIISYFQYGV